MIGFLELRDSSQRSIRTYLDVAYFQGRTELRFLDQFGQQTWGLAHRMEPCALDKLRVIGLAESIIAGPVRLISHGDQTQLVREELHLHGGAFIQTKHLVEGAKNLYADPLGLIALQLATELTRPGQAAEILDVLTEHLVRGISIYLYVDSNAVEPPHEMESVTNPFAERVPPPRWNFRSDEAAFVFCGRVEHAFKLHGVGCNIYGRALLVSA